MSKIFWKDCECGGAPECTKCGGSGRVRDYDADLEYADYCHDRDKDDRAERQRERDNDYIDRDRDRGED